MKQYIFVDVDGVLNPDKLRPGGFKHLALPYGSKGPGYYLNLHIDYGRWLLDLAEKTQSEIIWGTTWQEYANEWVGKPLLLPELPHLDLSDCKPGENLGSIKGRKAWNWAKDSKFVYFDDEPNIGYCIKGSNGLHICIDYRTGLEESHIQTAKEYLGIV